MLVRSLCNTYQNQHLKLLHRQNAFSYLFKTHTLASDRCSHAQAHAGYRFNVNSFISLRFGNNEYIQVQWPRVHKSRTRAVRTFTTMKWKQKLKNIKYTPHDETNVQQKQQQQQKAKTVFLLFKEKKMCASKTHSTQDWTNEPTKCNVTAV